MTQPDRSARLFKLAREFGILVVGVLLALAADSWWDDREAHRDVATLLEVTAAELASNEARLRTAVTAQVELLDAQRELLRMATSDAEPPESATTFQLIAASIGGPTLDLTFGGYEALISRGSAEFVDAGLMALLASHVEISRRGPLRDQDRAVDEGALAILADAVARHGGLNALIADPFRDEFGLPRSMRGFDLPGLLGDPLFEDALTRRFFTSRNYQSWLRERLRESEALSLRLADAD